MSITQTISNFPTPLPNRDNDTPTEFSDHVDAFIGHIDTHVSEENTWAEQINAMADSMNMEIGSMYVGTSSTSVEIGTGSKTFTVNEDGKAFAANASIHIVDAANPNTNYMEGTVTSYDTSTKSLVVNITSTGGSGTYSNWLINIGGSCNRIQDIPVSSSAPADKELLVYDSTSGEWEPGQPFNSIFCVQMSGNQSISAGATATINFNTERFDTNNDFDVSTYKYTAPISGKYQFNVELDLRPSDPSDSTLYITTSNKSYNFHFRASGYHQCFTASVCTDMDAGDTAYIRFYATNNSFTIYQTDSVFSGFLVG